MNFEYGKYTFSQAFTFCIEPAKLFASKLIISSCLIFLSVIIEIWLSFQCAIVVIYYFRVPLTRILTFYNSGVIIRDGAFKIDRMSLPFSGEMMPFLTRKSMTMGQLVVFISGPQIRSATCNKSGSRCHLAEKWEPKE